MKGNTRTCKVMRNTLITTVCQILYLIVSFACRTIFTNLLGAEYLGINGLFSNILTILSFAELGIGSALVYRMYAPLESGDTNEVILYLNLYKKVYMVILFVIILTGMLMIPFLNFLVGAPNVKENLTLLYILYLFDTAISYVYVYKKSILIADQKNYIVSIFVQIFNVLMNIMQIISLYLTHNFVLYCIIKSICTLLCNIACSKYADKLYPYMEKPAIGMLSKNKINSLKKDIKGLFLTKIANTAFSGTDNIFISVFIGLKYIGILSNYTMLLTTVNAVMNKIFDSITASIGNLALSGNREKTENVLKKIFFLNTSIYGYLCLGMFFMIEEFVTEIWFTKEYALSDSIILLITIELFFRSIHYPLYITRTALGAFSQYKVIFTGAAIFNILLDFLLVQPLGICGLYLSTIICQGITYIVDVWVVYHEKFKKSVWNYFLLIIQWTCFLLVNGVIMNSLLIKISLTGYIGFFVKIVIITLIYILMIFGVYSRSEEFKFYSHLINSLK